MKRCPFCAKEIQNAARFCQFCGRELSPASATDAPPTTTAPPPRSRVTTVLKVMMFLVMGLGALILLVAVAASLRDGNSVAVSARRPPPPLELSSAKSVLKLMVTNREGGTWTECLVGMTENGRADEWLASVDSIASLETASIEWSSFYHGQALKPMPSYLGYGGRRFTISCLDADGTRRSGEIRFSK